MTKPSLASLQSIHDWMRKVGATRVAISGDSMELTLGDAPPVMSVPDAPETPEQRELREEEDFFKTLLHSSGASVLPFVNRKKA